MGRRALGTYKQAVLVLRWFLDDTRMSALARDNGIAVSTAYSSRDEGIAVLAARTPSLHGALLAAKAAGHSHVIVDAMLIYTDRISIPGPTKGVDLWWSGKHHHHGGNIQVAPPRMGGHCGSPMCAPAANTTPAPPAPTPTCWPGSPTGSAMGPRAGGSGLRRRARDVHHPVHEAKNGELTIDQQSYNAIHGALRCLGERANSLLKTTYKALRRYRGCPWRRGAIVAAALVLLHHEHDRTT